VGKGELVCGLATWMVFSSVDSEQDVLASCCWMVILLARILRLLFIVHPK